MDCENVSYDWYVESIVDVNVVNVVDGGYCIIVGLGEVGFVVCDGD